MKNGSSSDLIMIFEYSILVCILYLVIKQQIRLHPIVQVHYDHQDILLVLLKFVLVIYPPWDGLTYH